MAQGGPLSPEGLSQLDAYKYSSVDKSPLSNYVLRHYWTAAVKLLPLWLAPNMVTLLGFFCILINVALLQIYIPDLVGPGPSWVYYEFALGLFLYQTLDNLDGKQARRTGTSSPLGELFDHGIDSLNCTLASLCQLTAVGLGPTPVGAFTALTPCFPMFFSTWETYHTHTLYLGFFNGPTEGLLLACVILICSGYYGPHIWKLPLANLFGHSETLGNLCFLDLWVPMIFVTFFLAHLPACIYNVVQARRRANLPILPVFLEWTPLIIFSASCGLWLGSPFTSLLTDNQLVLFCLTISFVFGRLTTKIILHHLTRQPFPYWTTMLLPLIGGAVLANTPRFGLPPIDPVVEAWYLRGYFVFATCAYFRWAYVVINKICDHLGIACFSIPSQSKTENTMNSQETKAPGPRGKKSA